jgi:hypothetical protein
MFNSEAQALRTDNFFQGQLQELQNVNRREKHCS